MIGKNISHNKILEKLGETRLSINRRCKHE